MKKILVIARSLLTAISAGTAAWAADPVLAKADPVLASGDWLEIAAQYPIPAMSDDQTEPPAPEVLADWWQVFSDDKMTKLILTALEKNRDLAAARSKVTEARAALGISKSTLLPWLDSNNSWARVKTSENAGGTGTTNNLFHMSIDATWEIDLFGGTRQKVKAGRANLEAQHAALHAAWVTLSSEVALNYISLRTLQQRLIIAEKNLALQEDLIDILQSRYDAGLTDELALSQARYTAELTRAAIPAISTGIEKLKNLLAILTGELPGSLDLMLSEPADLPEAEAVLPIGIPANALRQRPDIRAAERSLMAQLARKKSAETDYYPKFFLLGSIGLESISTGSLFSSASGIFNLMPRITWPIFHSKQIRSNIRVQTARQEQLLAMYEQTVLKAVAEVRNAVTEDALERERKAYLEKGIESAQSALDIATDKYHSGLVDFYNVISAQAALLKLEDEYCVCEGQILSSVIKTFKALGGGWAPLAAENLPEERREDSKEESVKAVPAKAEI
jgi:multidrug efflux system outer membrane protein